MLQDIIADPLLKVVRHNERSSAPFQARLSSGDEGLRETQLTPLELEVKSRAVEIHLICHLPPEVYTGLMTLRRGRIP